MSDVSKLVLLDGNEYDIKDATARQAISDLESYSDYLGVTTTALTDGASTNPITIGGEEKTAVKGNIANYGSAEFIFNGTAWQEFGDLSAIGALGYKDSADVSGTAAAQTFAGTQATISSTGNFTPEGSVALSGGSAQTVVTGMGNATTANITEVDEAGSVTAGSAASLTTSYSNETITFSFTPNTPTAVTLPTTKQTSVVTAQGTPTTDSVTVPDTATFSGTSGSVSVSATYTPEGTNSSSSVSGIASVSS